MEPIHPSERLEDSLLTLIIVLFVLVTAQVLLGHWDKFIAVAVEWFPLWTWGG